MSYTTARTMYTTASAVLRAHRGLRSFPVTSASVGLGFTGVAFAALFFTGLGVASPIPYPTVFVVYLLCVTMTVVGNAGLITQADNVLRGSWADPKAGRRAGRSRFFALLPWALAVATVLPVLRLFERTAREPGVPGPNRATPWSDVVYLVLPMIVLERRGPIDAVRAARECHTRVWGPGVAGTTRLGTLGYILVLVGGLLSMLIGTVLGALADELVGGVLLSTVGCWLGLGVFITVLAFYSAANTVYSAALYRYAVDGRTPPAFAGTDLARAFHNGDFPADHYDGYR
ncbi:hypothetical protein IU449_17765 [Nocardia higoensis]|uniref:Uncharacterized protein n=1 Tax=Nocardia higoensis TaxID=228599 RepID=A0ABS0DD51_9NOCA|nr:DUF6159 family protein [Nocardia higoensis]MBF6356370.1 hypothetical protein [Nocardia higoensis]